MDRKRYRMALMIFIIALIIGVNFMTIPLFLYGSFGSVALLDLSTVERVLNVLFLAWVFLVLPNLPLAGMLVSIRQMSQRYLYLHAGAFLLVVAAGIVFFMGESTLVWGTAEDKVSDHFVLSKDSPTLFDIEPKSMLPMGHAFLLFYEGTYFLV